MSKVLDFDLKVSKFDLQSRYYVHLRTNTFWGKVWSSEFPSNGLNKLLFYKDGLGIEKPTKVDIPLQKDTNHPTKPYQFRLAKYNL